MGWIEKFVGGYDPYAYLYEDDYDDPFQGEWGS